MDFIIRLAEEFFKKHKRLARYRRSFARAEGQARTSGDLLLDGDATPGGERLQMSEVRRCYQVFQWALQEYACILQRWSRAAQGHGARHLAG